MCLNDIKQHKMGNGFYLLMGFDYDRTCSKMSIKSNIQYYRHERHQNDFLLVKLLDVWHNLCCSRSNLNSKCRL